MKTYFKLIYSYLSIIVLLSFLLISCGKDDEPTAPELPSIESFEMKFTEPKIEEKSAMGTTNWSNSKTIVTTFSTLSATYMVVPIAAYKAMLDKKPIYLGNNTWEWTSSVEVVGATYTATLKATTISTSTDTYAASWEMKMSKTGIIAFTDFVWFSGTTTKTSATWSIFSNPALPFEAVKVQTTFDENRLPTSLRYTFSSPIISHSGSYCEWGKIKGAEFDRYYTVHLSSLPRTAKIEWSAEFGHGRIQSISLYNDTLWHCWNALKLDVTCR
jgi:hypothetical protein